MERVIYKVIRFLLQEHTLLLPLVNMVKKAKLGLNKGTTFGPGGEKHLRLNIGCPRSVLVEAMENLKNAVNDLVK